MPKTGSRRSAAKRPRRPPKRQTRRSTPSLRAIEATLAGLAHDIRTPLTGILALGELLAASELGSRERQWALAIKSTAEHMAALASLIVDAARAEARGLVLRRVQFSPRQLAEAVAATLAARAGSKELDAATALADDLPEFVLGDPVRLRAALENLIDNAVKFTERGSIRFDASVARALPRGRTRLVFTVSDSGIGLSSAETKRLFRPFTQVNEDIARRYGGAGLGLASVKRIAKIMGGDLTVKSRPGAGSVFRLVVSVDRVAPSADPHDMHARVNARRAATRQLHVLCAEDNPYGRVVLNTILSELGHRTDFVGTGEAAVAAAARGGYDLVLLDVTLPAIDGIEATRRIRALPGEHGRVPIIGISGRATSADEATARAAGMNGYLVKPLGPSVLAELLAEVT
jgi:CheY-like chemotaxis protein